MLFINWNKSLSNSIEYTFGKPGKEYKVPNYSEIQEKNIIVQILRVKLWE